MSADLDRDLRALGDELGWPRTPDLAATVAARLAEDAATVPERRRTRRPRRLLAAVAVAVLAPAAGAVAFPGARDDVLEWLGLRSVEVRRVPDLPAGARRASDAELGERVTLAQAAARAGFAPILPPRLGRPDEVRERDGVITLLYGELRLAQLRGTLIRKLVGPGTAVRAVPEGIFISGPRHVYLYFRPDRRVREARSAGNTLLTERGRLLLRLEGTAALTYERARDLLTP